MINKLVTHSFPSERDSLRHGGLGGGGGGRGGKIISCIDLHITRRRSEKEKARRRKTKKEERKEREQERGRNHSCCSTVLTCFRCLWQ